jgi:hypothetical protein
MGILERVPERQQSYPGISHLVTKTTTTKTTTTTTTTTTAAITTTTTKTF